MGMANLVGSAFSCYPVAGSFSRSAANNTIGAVSQLSGIITAAVMLVTLMVLTRFFYYLPKFALAAVVIHSVIPLVAISDAKKLLGVKRKDFLLWMVAFLGTLFLGVLTGLLVAVGVSLVIVVYESLRPQITILWRIPGTTIYRNMKQESAGAFVRNVFICRIGSSMYFANASFVKDMLLAYVSDLDEVNATEYIVLEMTPVVSIDTTAVHVFQDIVQDFRHRGIQVAFAMVGNRVEKTMRKAGLTHFIGQHWFFPTVNDAVLFCLAHQHAKRSKPRRPSENSEALTLVVHPSTEVAFGNELHHSNTMVFVSIVKEYPGLVRGITKVFRSLGVDVVRVNIEPLAGGGSKHTYLVKSARTGKKLTSWEIDKLREEIEGVIRKC